MVCSCRPCLHEGTECIFAGLSSVCHKSMTRQCVRGIPDRQILLMPYQDPHPEDDQNILDIIDELIDLDPYRISKFLSSAFGLRLLIPCIYRAICWYWWQSSYGIHCQEHGMIRWGELPAVYSRFWVYSLIGEDEGIFLPSIGILRPDVSTRVNTSCIAFVQSPVGPVELRCQD